MMLFILFVMGAAMGSFLTLVAVRSVRGLEWVKSRSVCDFCGKRLGVLDLIPVISFMGSKGKTRCCGKKLSLLYPISEILVGIAFVLIGIHSGTEFEGIILLGIVSLFWIIFVSDLLFEIIPVRVLLAVSILSVILILSRSPSCMSISPSLCMMDLWPHILSAVVPGFLFFCLWFFSQGKAMGDGDISLVMVLGFLVGYPDVVVFLYIAFLTGAIAGVILIVRHKKKLKSHISFGPFLIAGTGAAALWGSAIIQYFTHLWV